MILFTKGSKGASLILKNGKVYENLGYKVNAVDTTGAGDSCFGGFITKILDYKLSKDLLLKYDNYQEFLDFACKCGAYTTTGYGAISAMGSKNDVESVGN